MAGLVKIAAKIANKNSLGVIIRSASHWNKDWKPGPYPKTQAEREAAAKKYGMSIEEYEPYPDDGTGFGDYPKLPDISIERKDINYPYDYPEAKRNFNEPMHVHIDMYSEDRHNNSKLRYPIRFQFLFFTAFMTAILSVYYFLDDYKMFRPVFEKQIPANGKVHYSFEPAEK